MPLMRPEDLLMVFLLIEKWIGRMDVIALKKTRKSFYDDMHIPLVNKRSIYDSTTVARLFSIFRNAGRR
jgi:hypothetical protein